MKKLLFIVLLIYLLSVSAAQADLIYETPQLILDEQFKSFANARETWQFDDPYSSFGYAVTDLDHDGNPELLSACMVGTGMYTSIRAFEVGPDGKLRELDRGVEEGVSEPDVMQESVPVCYDMETDTYYYIFSDFIRNGYAETYQFLIVLSLKNGVIRYETLGHEQMLCTDPDHCETTYFDSEKNQIGAEDFDSLPDSVFANCLKFKVNVGWQMSDLDSLSGMSETDLIQSLQDSYQRFLQDAE